ncbi:hypothetical protein GOBAR_DD23759 [Gossypium barbadense]|nr:hypothetical protein GOBAR_DD23759 [Gossypium barbadense]
MVMKPIPITGKPRSWKDCLVGTGFRAEERSETSGSLDDDRDFEFSEADIVRSLVNGILSIKFSERVNQILTKNMSRIVVVKLLRRSTGYLMLHNKNPEDFEKVLCQGQWIVYGQYLTLPNLPGHMYKKKVLGDIRRTIGKVAKLDFNKDTGVQARFAGMTMYVNLEKWVEYEYLPTVCFSYRHYGHVKVLCPNEVKRLEDSEARGANGKEEHRTNLALNLVESTIDTSNYGPWMLVERKCRQHSRMAKGNNEKNCAPPVSNNSKGLISFGLEQQKEGDGHSADGGRGIQGPMHKSGLGIIMGQQRSGPLELGIGEGVNAERPNEVYKDESIAIGLMQTKLGRESPVTSLIRVRKLRSSYLTQNDELPKEARTTPIPMDPEVEEKEGLRIDGHSRSTVMTENLREVWGLQGCGNENNLKVIRLSKPCLGLKICRKC